MSKYLEDVRDMLCEELDEIGKSGKIGSDATLERIDMLTHSIKSIDTILAMEDGGYSEDRYGRYDHPYERGNSYARGRTGNVRRDSMGRYSRDGYSHNEGKEALMDDLRALMEEHTDSNARREIQQFMTKLEKM